MLSCSRRFLLLLALLALSACGSGGDSNTNGLLTLDASSQLLAGQHVVTATATYANGTASSVSGVPIILNFTARSASGTIGTPYSTEVFTDSSGTTPPVTVNYTQINEAILVTVTATTGGLRQSKQLELSAL
uniref:Big-1 domain-containing protein n=1 Tax=Citrifermentans bremense TaxID=60035 RepID=A0A6S6M256_9BACT